MADRLKRLLDETTGDRGGVKCECCNWSKMHRRKNRRNRRKRLTRIVRRKFGRETAKHIKRELNG